MPTLCLDLRDASVHIGDRFPRGSKANVHFRTASDNDGLIFNMGISAPLKQGELCLQLRIAHWVCVGGRALHWTRLVLALRGDREDATGVYAQVCVSSQ